METHIIHVPNYRKFIYISDIPALVIYLQTCKSASSSVAHPTLFICLLVFVFRVVSGKESKKENESERVRDGYGSNWNARVNETEWKKLNDFFFHFVSSRLNCIRIDLFMCVCVCVCV